jgi:hypothetical protein
VTASDVSLAISGAALALSAGAFALSLRRDRRDLFLRVHEGLVTTEQQSARRRLYQLYEQGKQVEDYSDDDYAIVNNALAALNVLGIYYERRYIKPRDVMQFWAVPLLRIKPAAEPFLAKRDSLALAGRVWPELRNLWADAEEFVRRERREGEVIGSPIELEESS